MTTTRRRGRSAAALATAALLGALCAPGAAGAAGAAQEQRAPGVPPPVDSTHLPSAQKAATLPFDHSEPGLRQVGEPAVGNRNCVASGDLPEATPTVESQPWGQLRLRLPELHRFATGAGQVVAVIDTGVTPHPRLAGRLRGGGDYLQSGDGLSDCDGHGTLVAGIIAAAGDPTGDTAFVGMAPDAQILAIRQSTQVLELTFFDERQGREVKREGAGNTASLALAVVHAVNQGATVINISEAACFAAQPNQINGLDLQAAVHFATERNVVVVAAAGNADGQSPCNPANTEGSVTTVASPAWFDDDVLTVGAVAEDGEPAPFTLPGPWVDVVAPGTEITSLDPAPAPGSDRLTNFAIVEGQRGAIQGTSFATPYVAGLAALIKQRFPHLTARQVMERIERTAQQSAGHNGRNDTLGHGMIDPVAALTAVIPEEHGVAPPPPREAQLENLLPQPRKDPLPTRVALIGAGAGLLALGVTGFVVFTVAKARRRRTA